MNPSGDSCSARSSHNMEESPRTTLPTRRSFSLKQIHEEIESLRKENFNLKLKIEETKQYGLQEKLIESETRNEILSTECEKYQKLYTDAVNVINKLEKEEVSLKMESETKSEVFAQVQKNLEELQKKFDDYKELQLNSRTEERDECEKYKKLYTDAVNVINKLEKKEVSLKMGSETKSEVFAQVQKNLKELQKKFDDYKELQLNSRTEERDECEKYKKLYTDAVNVINKLEKKEVSLKMESETKSEVCAQVQKNLKELQKKFNDYKELQLNSRTEERNECEKYKKLYTDAVNVINKLEKKEVSLKMESETKSEVFAQVQKNLEELQKKFDDYKELQLNSRTEERDECEKYKKLYTDAVNVINKLEKKEVSLKMESETKSEVCAQVQKNLKELQKKFDDYKELQLNSRTEERNECEKYKKLYTDAVNVINKLEKKEVSLKMESETKSEVCAQVQKNLKELRKKFDDYKELQLNSRTEERDECEKYKKLYTDAVNVINKLEKKEVSLKMESETKSEVCAQVQKNLKELQKKFDNYKELQLNSRTEERNESEKYKKLYTDAVNVINKLEKKEVSLKMGSETKSEVFAQVQKNLKELQKKFDDYKELQLNSRTEERNECEKYKKLYTDAVNVINKLEKKEVSLKMGSETKSEVFAQVQKNLKELQKKFDDYKELQLNSRTEERNECEKYKKLYTDAVNVINKLEKKEVSLKMGSETKSEVFAQVQKNLKELQKKFDNYKELQLNSRIEERNELIRNHAEKIYEFERKNLDLLAELHCKSVTITDAQLIIQKIRSCSVDIVEKLQNIIYLLKPNQSRCANLSSAASLHKKYKQNYQDDDENVESADNLYDDIPSCSKASCASSFHAGVPKNHNPKKR